MGFSRSPLRSLTADIHTHDICAFQEYTAQVASLLVATHKLFYRQPGRCTPKGMRMAAVPGRRGVCQCAARERLRTRRPPSLRDAQGSKAPASDRPRGAPNSRARCCSCSFTASCSAPETSSRPLDTLGFSLRSLVVHPARVAAFVAAPDRTVGPSTAFRRQRSHRGAGLRAGDAAPSAAGRRELPSRL